MAPEKAKAGCLVLAVQGGATLSRAAQAADRIAKGALRRALASGDLSEKAGSTLLLRGIDGLAAERVLLLRLGERGKYDVAAFRESLRGLGAALKALGAKDAVLPVADLAVGGRGLPWTVRHAGLGSRDAFYRFDQLKTQNRPAAPALASMVLAIIGAPVTLQAQAALKEAVATADGIDFARTLGNLPPNLCTPSYLADEARKLAAQFKLGIQILERRDMEKLGMGALLAVTAGSRQPPKLIVLRYNGASKKKKPLALVGKGITFDTGGISLKPGADMDEMKFDMSGAGSVLGAIRALAGMRAPVNVIGVVPTCENMPDGAATRPGDIVTTMSGQTVEILNTDAEGRLILCDALFEGDSEKPDLMIDCATLTGAARVALGPEVQALFSNNDALASDILRASAEAADPVWRLPIWKPYRKMIDSKVADMNNVSDGPFAGAIIGALYLSEFVSETTPWAHLDIFASNAKTLPGRPEGGEATGMRALYGAIRQRFA